MEDVPTATKGCGMLFNAPAGVPKYDYPLDGSGYVFTRVPVGEVSINYVMHPDGLTQHRFYSGELSAQLNEPRGIYYNGDITLDWQGTGPGKTWVLAAGLGGLPGALAGGALGQGRIAATVESNPVPAQEEFRRRFPNTQPVISSLLTVKPRN